MKKIIILTLFALICSVSLGYSQQLIRIGNLTLKDTSDGKLILKNLTGARTDIFLANLNASSLTSMLLNTNNANIGNLTISDGFFAVEEDVIASVFGNWDFGNNVHFSNDISVDGSGGFSNNVEIFGDLIMTGANSTITTSIFIQAPTEMVNLGGGSYECFGSVSDKWYGTLTEHSNIVVRDVAEGQKLTFYIMGGISGTLEPFGLTWTIHSTAGTELWFREPGNAPATQTLYTDKYELERMGGILYMQHFPGEAP